MVLATPSPAASMLKGFGNSVLKVNLVASGLIPALLLTSTEVQILRP